MGPADLIFRVFKLTGYDEYLKKDGNYEMRIENVYELMAFAKQQQDEDDSASFNHTGESLKELLKRQFQSDRLAVSDNAGLLSSNPTAISLDSHFKTAKSSKEIEVIEIDDESNNNLPTTDITSTEKLTDLANASNGDLKYDISVLKGRDS
jgi:hypothetical protein